MDIKKETRLQIRTDIDVATAADRGEQLAAAARLETESQKEVAQAITQLAANLIRYNGTGELILRQVAQAQRQGLEIISINLGPGAGDTKQTTENSYMAGDSSGEDWSILRDTMDELEIKSGSGLATVITTRKWCPRPATFSNHTQFNFGIASRPIRGEKFNGDAYFIKRYGDTVILAVIDGLGHGQEAQESSHLAINCLEDSYDKSLEEILYICHHCLSRTSGAAMAICRINLSSMKMTHSGVGNVSTRVYSPQSTAPNPFPIYGILGVALHKVEVNEYPLPKGSTIIMFSDGISRHFTSDHFPGFFNLSPKALAQLLLDKRGTTNDDAAVIVGRMG